jgi:serine/threonine protein kinase
MQPEVVITAHQRRLLRRELLPGQHLIGADPACEFWVTAQGVAWHHARLVMDADRMVIEDLGSATGTYVDDVRVEHPTVIRAGQKVRVGEATVELRLAEQTMADTIVADDTGAISPTVAPAVRSTAVMQQGGKYMLGEVVARGGMGEVYQASDLNIQRTVALKVMRDGTEADHQHVMRFIREAQLTGQLEHPNIVPIHELGLDERGRAFYSMKFVQGVTLYNVLQNIGQGDTETIARYSLGNLLTIFQKVCDAVAFAHSRGVVHRDLKPENVMIGSFGEVLVMDWGLAKLLPEALVSHDAAASVPGEVDGGPRQVLRTLAGKVMGTPSFMAPEQAEGRVHEIDTRTDIYSLGAILYNILTLHAPAEGNEVDEVLRKVRSGNIASPLSHNPPPRKFWQRAQGATPVLPHCPGNQVPESLAAVAMKALSHRRSDRYQTVAELQKDIDAYQGGFAPAAEKAGVWKLVKLTVRRRKTEFMALVIAVAVIFALTVAAMVQIIGSEHRARTALDELRGAAPTYYAAAKALVDDQEFAEALEKVKYALSLDSEKAEYYRLKGNLHQSLLNLAAASQSYHEAMRRDRDDAQSAANLALCQKLLSEADENGELPPGGLLELQAAMIEQGRFPEALAMMQKFQSDKQVLFDTWRAVLAKAGIFKSGDPRKMLQMDPTGQFQLDLTKSPVENISILKGMPLQSLNLSRSRVTSLEALRGSKLQVLVLTGSAVTDLSPLRGVPLQTLVLDHSKVTDLSVLKGMPLQTLSVEGLPVTDLSGLDGLPLKRLNLAGTRVEDIEVLRGKPLVELDLSGTRVTDLTPLSACPLLETVIIPANARGVEILKTLPYLKRISDRPVRPGRFDDVPAAAEFWRAYKNHPE